MYVAGGAVWARAGAAGHSTRTTSKTIRIRLWTVVTSRLRPYEFSFIVVPSAGLPNAPQQPRPEEGAQRTLEGVGWRLLGVVEYTTIQPLEWFDVTVSAEYILRIPFRFDLGEPLQPLAKRGFYAVATFISSLKIDISATGRERLHICPRLACPLDIRFVRLRSFP